MGVLVLDFMITCDNDHEQLTTSTTTIVFGLKNKILGWMETLTGIIDHWHESNKGFYVHNMPYAIEHICPY